MGTEKIISGAKELNGSIRFEKDSYRLPTAFAVITTLYIPLLILWLVIVTITMSLAVSVDVPGVAELAFVFVAVVLPAAYFITAIVIGIWNIVRGLRLLKEGELGRLANSMLILKYGMIFFFILNFMGALLYWLVMFAASRGTIIFMLPVVAVLILIHVLVTWAVMLPGSIYGVQTAICACREHKISVFMTVVFSCFQFFFVTDVLSSLLLSWKLGYGKKSGAVVAFLYLAAAAGLIWIIYKIKTF